MNIKTDATSPHNKLDTLKWWLVLLLMGGSFFSFYYFEEHSLLLRVISLLVLSGMAVWLSSTTEKGRYAIDFIRESHLEVRKVVWPTREETVQMTALVVFLVIVLALIIWGLDGILMWLVRLLTSR